MICFFFGSVPQMNMNLALGKSMRWWEKGLQPNMREIESAQDLVDALTNAGDRLVVVDFFSPGCGGCRAFHPKICQFAEQNPDVLFLQVNYEEHKSMCHSLHVHVLPLFRFYRGAQGRLCSFSCTNATIKKFRDALAKHKPDRCSLGPTRGLEESELLALAANKDLQFTYAKQEPELIPRGDAPGEVVAPEPAKLPAAPKPLVRLGSEERSGWSRQEDEMHMRLS
uniref:Thioredoxin domain-containing protein n=1 Tax=Zea mays TaxID=4577 RepID=A0A804LJJ1_MAIZE